MRTKESNEAAFLEAPNDPVFLESYEIVKNNPLVANRSPLEQGKIQQHIFTITCDKSVEKASFEIGLMPQCPTCGSRNMASGHLSSQLGLAIAPVTHASWMTKSLSEKIAAVDEAIRRIVPIAGTNVD